MPENLLYKLPVTWVNNKHIACLQCVIYALWSYKFVSGGRFRTFTLKYAQKICV